MISSFTGDRRITRFFFSGRGVGGRGGGGGGGGGGGIERDQDVTKSRTQQRVRNNGLALYGRKEIPDFLDFQDFYANLQLPH